MATGGIEARVASILAAVRNRTVVTRRQRILAGLLALSLLAPTAFLRARTEPIRLRIGGNVQAAKLLYKERPLYPPEAKQARIQGTVNLRAVINQQGQLMDLHVLDSPDDSLSKSAIAAVGQWRYQPTHLNGKPVEVETKIAVNYTLTQ